MKHLTSAPVLKLALLLSVSTSVTLAQSLSSLSCSPASLAVGASSYCTVQLTSAASLAGFPVRISTTGTGLKYPATVTIPWLRSTSTFSIATSSSTAPQVATMIATAGSLTRAASLTVTATATYSISSLTCTPARLVPDQKAACVAYLSAQAPPGGLVATLTTSSPDLSIPASVSIPASGTGFLFQAAASSLVTIVESATITAAVNASKSQTVVTIDPTPKFYLKSNNQELSVLANGALVAPSIAPSSWIGALTVRGTGSVAPDPVVGAEGFSFHRSGGQNADTAFINFSGGASFGAVFDNASELWFLLKSAYSFAERKALPASNMRGAFEVFDDLGPWYNFTTYTTSAGQLQFSYGARGYSGVYTVPPGREDVLFGKGVVAKIGIKWTATSISLYINGTLAATAAVAPKTANWSSRSAFTIGSRSVRIGNGGYYASDDSIAEFAIR